MKAIIKKCNVVSKVFSAAYKIKLAVPTASVKAGTYTDTKTATLSSSCDGEIYYTLNGTAPTAASTKYTEPFTIDKNAVTLKAIVKEGNALSKAFSAI